MDVTYAPQMKLIELVEVRILGEIGVILISHNRHPVEFGGSLLLVWW